MIIGKRPSLWTFWISSVSLSPDILSLYQAAAVYWPEYQRVLNLLFIEPSQNTRSQPSLSAASVMWAAAIPISIKGKYLSFILAPKKEVIFIDSSTTRICTGASLANLFIPKPAAAFPAFWASSLSVMTTNFQGCALQAEAPNEQLQVSVPTFPAPPDVPYHTNGHFDEPAPIEENQYMPFPILRSLIYIFFIYIESSG